MNKADSPISVCAEKIRNYIYRTPVLKSRLINDICGAEIYFKCENFQKMGAFKMRGASHAILNIPESKRSNGVVTHSSGNMAQAVALSAYNLGIPAYIVMPDNAPKVKVDAVKTYGGIVTLCEPTIDARQRESDKIMERTVAQFIHPSNDLAVIEGQGTAAYELLQDYPDLDMIIVPVGGGGLLAGTALAAKELNDECEVYGAEPSEADDAFRSFHSGKIEFNLTANTIADGLRTNLGSVNFPIIQSLVKDIVTVEEDEIIESMKYIYERLKIVVEPSSAVPLAAVIKSNNLFSGKKVGIIISGGNVDLSQLPFLR